ncbi:adenine phosphoribosyltransferase [Bifidobacterium favimelis]|uniref:Adenine phosphoribosyltransferase n=1 Tax=Bifidobacterium favimelis TaxID=3122979 RepID=A0ABU8ZN35_9BIFI
MNSSEDISFSYPEVIGEQDAAYLISLIRTIPDFPKKGILFRDFIPALADPRGLSILLKAMMETLPVPADQFDAVAGLEARGFLIGPQLATSLGKGFLALRKKGKLPPQTFGQEYSLEYGSAMIEMEKDCLHDGERVLIVDDLIATGGSAQAAAKLIEQAGGQVAGFSFAMELEGLEGRHSLDRYPVTTLMTMPA